MENDTMSAGALIGAAYFVGAMLWWPIITVLIARHERGRTGSTWDSEDWIMSACGGAIGAMAWPLVVAGYYVIEFAKWALNDEEEVKP
jgi:hypothetical protein